MKRLVSLGLSIGVLAGVFTWFAFTVTSFGSWASPLVVWVGFAAWACFYALGGGMNALRVSGLSLASGVFWGWAIAAVWLKLSPSSMVVLGICVAVGAFMMCVQAALPPLAFIPSAFVGAAAYFGFAGGITRVGSVAGEVIPAGFTSTGFWSVLLSVIGGTVFAFLSEKGADVIEKALGGTPPVVEPAPVQGRTAEVA